jgi:hypothetical protein
MADELDAREEYRCNSYQSESVITVDSEKNVNLFSREVERTQTIVNIIQRCMWVVWVIDDQRPSQTITVLG